MADVKGFCVRCKQMKELHDVQEVTLKNGRPALKGLAKCELCEPKGGTVVYKILPSKKKK
ncbi:MAG: DUF5679 domain-containing protein [bacterium]